MTAPVVVRYPLAHVSYGDEEINAVTETLRQGRTTCGPAVARFEHQFASYVGRKHAVMVNSGSSADLLVAHGLGPAEVGDEVLLPAVTWPTQIWAVLMAGYTVRLVDVDPATLQMDVASLGKLLSTRTKAIFLVHALGNVGDIDMIKRLTPTTIIEDCCEAMGSTWRSRHVGMFGQAAAFSFFFSHLLSTMEGGMVVTDDDPRMYRLWRSHGWEPTKEYHFWFPTWGYNIRPTELQGAFGVEQIPKLARFRHWRSINFHRLAERTYMRHWTLLDGVTVLPDCSPSWHGFPLMVKPDAPFTKRQLCAYLEEHGIETRPIIAGNFARQPVARTTPLVLSGLLPGADAIHDRGFYIGLASFDDPDGTSYVGDVLDRFVSL